MQIATWHFNISFILEEFKRLPFHGQARLALRIHRGTHKDFARIACVS